MSKQKLVSNLREHAKFLSFEYLTWLFLFLDHESCQENKNKITANISNFDNIILGNKLTLVDLQNSEQKISVASPLLEERSEIFAGLKLGFVVDSLGINIKIGEISVTCVLYAGDLAFGNVKINANFEESFTDDAQELSAHEKDREDLFLRMAALDDLEIIIKNFLDYFLQIRLDHQKYGQEISNMKSQIENRLQKLQDNTNKSHKNLSSFDESSHPPVF